MILNHNTEIVNYTFDKNSFLKIKESELKDRWPVVYIIEENKKRLAYIGETTDICQRVNQHWCNKERKKLDRIHIIHNKTFNKSVILDLETFLIKYLAADGIYKLQNSNGGQHIHNYYQREEYQEGFKEIWQMLQSCEIVHNDIKTIENSDLFKYSPYNTLKEEQYEVAKQIINRLKDDLAHNVVSRISIIDGGAGTGKSILGIFLLKLFIDAQVKLKWTIEDNEIEADLKNIIGLLDTNLKIGYVAPMQNFRKTLKTVFKSIKGLRANMVLSPADVANSKEKYDILIIDESHRLRKRYGLSGGGDFRAFDKKNKDLKLGKDGTELDWILEKSRFQWFFYDSKQTIRPSDIDAIRFLSIIRNEHTYNYKLTSQLRCKGGKDYIQYIHNIFECKQANKTSFPGYDFKLYEDVNEMVCEIKKKNKEKGLCRNIAGYSWEWKTQEKSLEEIKEEGLFDIEIDNNKYIWNRTSTDWINSPNAIDEIGCIHTTQGFDLNYAGVIIGREIDYNEKSNKIIIYKENYKDAKGKVKDQQLLLAYIKNIYITLLERGMYGTYVYVCNEALRNYLKQYIDIVPKTGGY